MATDEFTYEALTPEAQRTQLEDVLRAAETDHFRLSLVEEPAKEERLAALEERIVALREKRDAFVSDSPADPQVGTDEVAAEPVAQDAE